MAMMLDAGFYHMDCMDGMKRYPDKHFDIAVVDPPYYSGPERRTYYGYKESPIGVSRSYTKSEAWDVPDEEYFRELERVSWHQIVFGCNYFQHQFPPGRIVWDKCNGKSTFSDAEIAATDLIRTVRLFPFMWNGMMQGRSIDDGRTMQGNKKMNEKRIHPTQKPVALYQWIAREFIKPGWKVLDTHVGSASSLIAYRRAGIEYTGFEKDARRFSDACVRMELEKAQVSVYDCLRAEGDTP